MKVNVTNIKKQQINNVIHSTTFTNKYTLIILSLPSTAHLPGTLIIVARVNYTNNVIYSTTGTTTEYTKKKSWLMTARKPFVNVMSVVIEKDITNHLCE